MQFNNKNIDSPDDFSLQVSEKLKAHPSPVDPQVWESIEKRLPSAKRTLAGLWWWVASAVAVIGLLFFIWPFGLQDAETDEFVVQQQETENISSDKTPAENKQEVLSITEIEKEPVYVQEKTQSASVKPEKERVNERQPSLIAAYLRDRVNAQKPKKETLPPSISEQKTNDIVPDNFISEEQIPETPTQETNNKIAEPEDKLRRETKLITRLGGGAGNTGFAFNGRREAMYADSPIGSELGSVKNDTYKVLTPSDYSEIQHLPPVSVSVMAEFPLNRTWSIETGLMYTYLASKYKKPDGNTYTGTLQLHYLGLPLNLKMNLYQNDSWRIYVLGGGAMEKGIASVYKQTIQYQNGPAHHLIKRSDIKGLQFSSHVAAGFDYKINQNIRLFGEPYLIYYFNNNQPMSARTENPLSFGLNTGIRIQF